MKGRNFWLLLVAAAVLCFWAYRVTHISKQAVQPQAVGRLVFADLPINDVACINIATAQTNFTLKKQDEKWVVAERFNYPAKFSKITETLLDLRELKIGQAVPAAQERLAEFDLLSPETTNAAGHTATRLELRDAKNKKLAELLIGKHFTTQPPRGNRPEMMFGGGYPSGHYVRLPDGMVVLVGKTLDRLIEPITSWLADEFVNVPAADISEISITGPDRAPVQIQRDPVSKVLKLADLKEEEGTADSSKLGQAAGALSYLSFQDVADPALSPEVTGLDAPVVFTAVATNGCIYKFNIGKTVSSNSTDRYVSVRVEYIPPPTPTNQLAAETNAVATNTVAADQKPAVDWAEKARALNAALSPWIYILRSYRADNMLFTRDKLITPPPPPAEKPAADAGAGESAAQTNQPPQKASEKEKTAQHEKTQKEKTPKK